MGKFFDVYFCKARLSQHFPCFFLTPHGAQAGAVASPRDRHAVHNRNRVEQRAHRVVGVFVNVGGCRNILHQKRSIRVQGVGNFFQSPGQLPSGLAAMLQRYSRDHIEWDSESFVQAEAIVC